MTSPTIHASLKSVVNFAHSNSPFYRHHFRNVDIANLSLEKFRNLPFTTKDDLAQFNEKFCCVPREKIVELVTTSGTLGDPVTLYLTKNDLDRLAVNEAYSLKKMGGNQQDRYQLLTTMDRQFVAGLAYYSGVVAMGASIIRTGPGIIPMQWNSILRNEPTVLISVPSFVNKLLDFAETHGIDFRSSTVKSVICIGEPIHNNDFTYNNLAEKILKRWDVKLNSTYASTEMATAFFQCQNHRGCHNNDELLYTEVINDDGEHVENGQQGEIVISTLGVEGTPLIRYKTGDVATYWSDTCGCGENAMRIGPILGRKRQLIKFKGTSIYPQTIFNVLNEIREISSYFIEVEQYKLTTKEIFINLAEEEILESQLYDIRLKVQSSLRVSPKIVRIPKERLDQKILNRDKRKPTHIQFIQL